MELVDKKDQTLVVIIPAYNEEETIGNVVRSIPRDIEGISEVLVVIVNDGSKDNTVSESLSAGADYVVNFTTNNGVGFAFKEGITTALQLNADIIVNLDADGQHDSNDISKLITPIISGNSDVVVGSRFLDSTDLKMPLVKRLGNLFFTKSVVWSTGVHLTDCQSGFRALSREAALKLNLIGKFTYTQESLIELAMKNLRITEIPIKVKQRNGESKVVKHCYSYGIKALLIILRALRDFKPLAFFGSIGSLVLAIGFVSGLFVFSHWILNGQIFPYASLLDFTVLSCLSGLFLIVLALMSDMQVRQRRIQEETLYYTKQLYYNKLTNAGSEFFKKYVDVRSIDEQSSRSQSLDNNS